MITKNYDNTYDHLLFHDRIESMMTDQPATTKSIAAIDERSAFYLTIYNAE